MPIASTNPTTGETVRTFDELTPEEVDAKLRRAAEAFATFRTTSYAERADLMRRTADLLDAEVDQLARLATLEMGKTFASAKAEVTKSAKGLRWFADHGERELADVAHQVEAPGAKVFTRYEPIGPVLAVMPWNFPYWQVLRFAGPTLMAGNVALLKHASNVPQCALAVEDVFSRAGLPDGVFQTLLVSSKAVEEIIDDDRIRAVTLTGSEPAGRSVGGRAGHNIKPSVLELGGADAFIVMPSADLEHAVENAVTSRMINNGQSCINAKRFIVHEAVAEEFERLMVERMSALIIGDPMDEATDVGPVSSASARDELDQQVRDLIGAGARVATGGKPLNGPGSFYPPTVIVDIPADAPGAKEELFGPVAMVRRARDIDEAIRIANETPFGLGGSAWTADPEEQRRFVAEVDTGMMFINKFTESAPPVPFGGVKNSGYGREMSGVGLRTFTNPKTVWIAGG